MGEQDVTRQLRWAILELLVYVDGLIHEYFPLVNRFFSWPPKILAVTFTGEAGLAVGAMLLRGFDIFQT
jgi:hypothetical protein